MNGLKNDTLSELLSCTSILYIQLLARSGLPEATCFRILRITEMLRGCGHIQEHLACIATGVGGYFGFYDDQKVGEDIHGVYNYGTATRLWLFD